MTFVQPSPEKSILVVEDDESIRETLRYALELEGYQVFTAENGRLAIDLLATIPAPGLILLDLMMPEMNGWEFVEETQKNGSFSNIPVIIISAVADKAKKIKANGIIKKPVDLEYLFGVVEKWCRTGNPVQTSSE